MPPTGKSLDGPRVKPGPRSYVLFESGQVRPMALSGDGSKLFVTNTPDGQLEIFDVSAGGLSAAQSVPVGLEPVALAEAPDGSVWVVNHLSDSISVVDVTSVPARVIRTLLVGDEPRDIVFAGSAGELAFITTAHRGQNSPVDPQLTAPSIGRADVWVFDSTDLGTSLGGEPLDIVQLFGDTPRALAVSNDGETVYAAIFRSGNRTTVIGPSNINKPGPQQSADGVVAPDSGLILKFRNGAWLDDNNQNFSGSVPFSLPDNDVFEIDATSSDFDVVESYSNVGTTLFNMAVNPVSGDIYVANTEARNQVRFAGESVNDSSSVRGRLTDDRITVISGGDVDPVFLNSHIDFSNSGSVEERAISLAQPMQMAVTADGNTLFVVAFGSGRVGVLDTDDLSKGVVSEKASRNIELSAGGPSGIVLDETNSRAYVHTRFDNGISIIDLSTQAETGHLKMFNPEPSSVTKGRKFLYDANLTSGHGNESCASCHLFGDNDALSWDLGEPAGRTQPIVNKFIPISPAVAPFRFHPMKGPMTTQSMRGLVNHGPMHWRGDRSGKNRSAGETIEEAAFKEFNDAFEALQGKNSRLSIADMQRFTDFAMQLTYPPNPIRALDGSLNELESEGQQLFRNGVVRVQTGNLEICGQCHQLNQADGQFGSKGLMADNSQPGEQNFKIPHFRDQYQKVGMFGFGFNSAPARGPQVRGFGYNHNGATSGNFALADLGRPDRETAALRAFLFAFPTESAFILGQQITLTDVSGSDVDDRIDLLVARAKVTDPIPECDLVAHAVVGGERHGWTYHPSTDQFRPDESAAANLSLDQIKAFAADPTQPVTFTCVPWGSGKRIGRDRDLDGILNGDE